MLHIRWFAEDIIEVLENQYVYSIHVLSLIDNPYNNIDIQLRALYKD